MHHFRLQNLPKQKKRNRTAEWRENKLFHLERLIVIEMRKQKIYFVLSDFKLTSVNRWALCIWSLVADIFCVCICRPECRRRAGGDWMMWIVQRMRVDRLIKKRKLAWIVEIISCRADREGTLAFFHSINVHILNLWNEECRGWR